MSREIGFYDFPAIEKRFQWHKELTELQGIYEAAANKKTHDFTFAAWKECETARNAYMDKLFEPWRLLDELRPLE